MCVCLLVSLFVRMRVFSVFVILCVCLSGCSIVRLSVRPPVRSVGRLFVCLFVRSSALVFVLSFARYVVSHLL